MDEPFTGLDPVNLVLLREAFLELRDRGRTLIFSTHQMETAEAMCESVAIVDHGRLVAGGRVRDLKRASGRRSLRLAVDGDVGADVAGRAAGRRRAPCRRRRERARAVARRRPGRRPRGRPRPGPLGHPLRGRRADPRGAVHRARRPARRREPQRWRPRSRRRRSRLAAWPDGATATRSCPNAAIVARREYRDRVRSPLFLVSTVVLMGLALLVAVAPIAIRYFDRQTVTRIAVVSGDAGLGRSRDRPSPTGCSTSRPTASTSPTWRKPYSIEQSADGPAADAALRSR